ncbi:hypothetical protein Tco_0756374, partial [Tanacetum coccineum]
LQVITEINDDDDDDVDDDDERQGECDLKEIFSSKRKHVAFQIQRGDSDDVYCKCVSVLRMKGGSAFFDNRSDEDYAKGKIGDQIDLTKEG